jgi:guanine deaminase
MEKIFKGNIIFTKEKECFEQYENGYIIVDAGKVKLVTKELPHKYKNMPVEDMGNQLIIPGFIDLHVHASQWVNTGIGYSKELIPWLNEYTFPLESKFNNLEYAKESYSLFIHDLWKAGTTRSCIYATRHKAATQLLIDLFAESGLGAYIGKVNMDRNAIPELMENTNDSIRETKELVQYVIDLNNKKQIKKTHSDFTPLVQYILTPRFVPSTTKELMIALGEIAKTNELPVQSHLNENRKEVAWVKQLHPEIESFTKVYDSFDLLQYGKTIMAHCIYCTEEEIKLLQEKQVYVAHCPHSNFNLASGIMPLRSYLNYNIPIGLGSDVGGGHVLDMRQHMIGAIHASKMYYVDHPEYPPISISEAFYLATKGGGSFFGNVGSFEEGYEFDALVINDDPSHSLGQFNLAERLEKFIYTGSLQDITKRYIRGIEIER